MTGGFRFWLFVRGGSHSHRICKYVWFPFYGMFSMYTRGENSSISHRILYDYILRISGLVQAPPPLFVLRLSRFEGHLRSPTSDPPAKNWYRRTLEPPTICTAGTINEGDNKKIEQPKDSPLKFNSRHGPNTRRGRQHEFSQSGFPSKSQLG